MAYTYRAIRRRVRKALGGITFLTVPRIRATEHGFARHNYRIFLSKCYPHNVTFIRMNGDALDGKLISFTYQQMFDILFNGATIAN